MKIRPLHDRILVKRQEEKERAASSFLTAPRRSRRRAR